MSLGFAKGRAKGTAEFDPMVEFREGVELLKNDYPQKALADFAGRTNATSITPSTSRFWDCRPHAQFGSGNKRRSFAS